MMFPIYLSFCIQTPSLLHEFLWGTRQGKRKLSRISASKDKALSQKRALFATLKCYYDEIFIFFSTVFLKNVKCRCKLREITMNRVRLNFFCLDITLQKSRKLVRHYFVRKPRVRCILQQRFVL